MKLDSTNLTGQLLEAAGMSNSNMQPNHCKVNTAEISSKGPFLSEHHMGD